MYRDIIILAADIFLYCLRVAPMTWASISGTDGRYQINKSGCIRSLYYRWGQRKKPKILAPRLSSQGYSRVLLFIQGASKDRLVSRLVLIEKQLEVLLQATKVQLLVAAGTKITLDDLCRNAKDD